MILAKKEMDRGTRHSRNLSLNRTSFLKGFSLSPKSLVRGFTLTELLVVVIIVGILAALAIPVFRQNIKRAMATEGYALVGSIRTAERVYFAEHNTYTSNWEDISGNVDLNNNKYFATEPTLTASGSGSSATFTATVTGSGDASGISISINHKGIITTSGL